eukprot:TRINITY_DN7358_c0_g1_i1.p1 TRINITY_DN7358_c0_g1~~TRINITY_DN7358_c0_g1_i1.p1  ORF type:complete len:219 (+),score=4.82 TRINITY_DN7358_c0_g1_i1:23-658(+)
MLRRQFWITFCEHFAHSHYTKNVYKHDPGQNKFYPSQNSQIHFDKSQESGSPSNLQLPVTNSKIPTKIKQSMYNTCNFYFNSTIVRKPQNFSWHCSNLILKKCERKLKCINRAYVLIVGSTPAHSFHLSTLQLKICRKIQQKLLLFTRNSNKKYVPDSGIIYQTKQLDIRKNHSEKKIETRYYKNKMLLGESFFAFRQCKNNTYAQTSGKA